MRRGMFVALTGPDGSGKSSVLRAFDELIGPNKSFRRLKEVHAFFGILPPLKALLPRKNALVSRPAATLPGMVAPKTFLVALVYFAYYLVDFILGRSVVGRARATGDLLVADRYFYDYYFVRSFRNLPTFVIRWGARLSPKPDMTLCFLGDPESVHARKPELSVQELEIQFERIKRYSKEFSVPVMLDTRVGRVEMIRHATEALIKRAEGLGILIQDSLKSLQ